MAGGKLAWPLSFSPVCVCVGINSETLASIYFDSLTLLHQCQEGFHASIYVGMLTAGALGAS